MATSKNKQQPLDRQAIVYMALLALQFGFQPALTRRFTPPTVCRSSVVLCQEVIKFCLAFIMLYMSGNFQSALEGWTVRDWIAVAGIPAALYAIQNLAALLAYQNLDAIAFNVLNQTKTLSAALCCYLVMGRRQSQMQVLALLLLLLSALVMERIVTLDWWNTTITTDDDQLWEARHFTHGVAPILLASFLSGLAGALSQKNLQGGAHRNPYLFSIELCAASTLILAMSLLISSDGECIRQGGFWKDFEPQTFIPIGTNAVGGILVGLVTKYAGSVRKGFALIFGIFLSGMVQSTVSREQWTGGALAAASLWLHATNPPKEQSSRKIAKQD